MIKNFEEFVSTVYGSAINEAFQSSKLRELVKQHGELKYPSEKMNFYDLTDNDIIDVVANYDEYEANRYDNSKYDGMKVSTFEFKDGTCVVYNFKDVYKLKRDRHKGNAKINWRTNKLDKLIVSYIKRNYKENIEKLINAIYTADTDSENPLNKDLDWHLDRIEDYDEDITLCVEEEDDIEKLIGFSSFSYNNNTYEICSIEVNYEPYGHYTYVDYTLESFIIYTTDGIFTNEDLDITEKTHKDLFNNAIKVDVDCGDWEYDYCPPRPH